MSNENSPIPTPSKTVFGLSEKVFLASQAALISLLVAALTTLGVLTTARVNDRSVDADFTKIALSMLAEDFDPKKPEYAREFAVKMLEQSSGIELTEAERTAWVKDGDVIGKGWVMSAGVCQPAISLPSGLQNLERSLDILSAYGESTVFVADRAE